MKFLVIVSISILFVSCSEDTTEPAITDSKITGKVTDINGNLLNDVDVYLVYNLIDKPLYQIEKICGIDTVELTSFTAAGSGEGVRLNWTTAMEINNKGFEIQRKTLNMFEAIGFVNGIGTSTEPHSYSFIDTNVSVGTYRYRLKQIDFDSTFRFSDEIEVSIAPQPTFYLAQNYPNPVQGITSIKYQLIKQCYCNLEVINYYTSESLQSLVHKEQQAGIYIIDFDNLLGLTNNIYNIYLKAIGVYFTEFEDTVTMLINENDVFKLIQTLPFVKTENGNFEIKLSDLPLTKMINITTESSPDIINQQVISNSLKFVLYKAGYSILEVTHSIVLNGQNEFNFVMEKQ